MHTVLTQRRCLQHHDTKPEAFVAEAAVALARLKTPERKVPEGSTRNVRSPLSPTTLTANTLAKASAKQQITLPANAYQRAQREAAQASARQLARAWLLEQQSPAAGLQDLAALVGGPLANRYYAEALAAMQTELREQKLSEIVDGLAFDYMFNGKSPQEPLKNYRTWLGDETVDRAWARAIAGILKASGQARRGAD